MLCNDMGQINILEPEAVKCFGPVMVVITGDQPESFKCLIFFHFKLVIIH